MDANTGKLYETIDSVIEDGAENDDLIPVTNREEKFLKKRPYAIRKNHMRNKQCICGSGKKFKNCCWPKYGRNHRDYQ